MPSHKVLLVEDDPEIVRIISGYLAGEEFEVIWCHSAQEAMEHPGADFDAALLDIMLGDGSGLDVCAQIRAGGDCPIIFVSCLDDPETMVTALELGGDDYIVKPFDKRVLAARLKANLRRVKGLQHAENQRSVRSFGGVLPRHLDSNSQNLLGKNVETHPLGTPASVVFYQQPQRILFHLKAL